MRQFFGLAIGLIVGIAGATLYLKSLPPDPGSLAEETEQTKADLKKAKREIATLKAETGNNTRSRPGDSFSDRTRRIADDIRAGRLVDIDEVFNATKPLMRDLNPLFERIRLRDQKNHFDTIAGNFSREYNLTPAQEENLQRYLEKKGRENTARYSKILTSDQTTFEDFVRASDDFERDDGLDEFMEDTLQGETLEQFKTNRLMEKIERVQDEADRKMERLDQIVDLDETQKDQVFTLMARSSQDYDPEMQFEGLTSDTTPLTAGQSRKEAILSVLNPGQRATYEAYQDEQRAEAAADLREIGLKLPANWDVFDQTDL